MKAGCFKQWAAGVAVMALPLLAQAQAADPKPWQLNMGKGVTHLSQNAYEAHMLALWICVVIGVLVFGAMAVAMFRFRHSKGAKPDTSFTHSTKLEIIWTVVPVALLVLMAFPATSKLINMYDTRDAEMTVKITGYQWMWKYDYLGENVGFTSRLDRGSDEIRQSGVQPNMADNPHYLLEVDNMLVLPVDTKIRFVITADDVIHAWWVPALGWKQDAIPGIVNEAWTEIEEPGIYRGQCAELCGKDHGFMPIVVKAVSKDEYRQWLADQRGPVDAVSPEVPQGSDGNAPSQLDPQMLEDIQQGDEPTVPVDAAPDAPADAPAEEAAPEAAAPVAG